MIANPLYKIGTKKKNPSSGNECPPPPPPKQFEQLPQFGIDKDNFKN
jgi:hypothetical protein